MPQILLWGQSTAQHPHWSIPWSSLSWGSGLQQGQLGIYRVLQELLTQELLEAAAIPRGTALVSPLPLLHSVCYSPFSLAHFLPLLLHLLVRSCWCRNTPQYVKGVWCWEWTTASLRSLRYFHGTWGSCMENTKSDVGLREVIPNGYFWCLLEVCTLPHSLPHHPSPDQSSSPSSAGLAGGWAEQGSWCWPPPPQGHRNSPCLRLHPLFSEGVGGRKEQWDPPPPSCTHQISLSNLSL